MNRKFSRTFILVFISLFLVAAFCACEKKAVPIDSPEPATEKQEAPVMSTESAKMPPPPSMQRPQVTLKQRQVVSPDFLKGKYKGVKLKVYDKKADELWEIEVPFKKVTKVEKTDLDVFVEHYFPSFFMSPEKITSVSADETNPAAKVKITKGDKVLLHRWIFSKMPKVHAFSHDKWEILLVGGIPAETPTEEKK